MGVLSNSPLKERIGNQNRLAAFAKVGKEVVFPNDFAEIISEKPIRTSETIASANNCINLDKDQLRFALFWFINGSAIDGIALKHLQMGNIYKAREIFEKKETFTSLINCGIIAFVEENINTGFYNISKVIHDQTYRTELLQSLGITNLAITEDEMASLFIAELLKYIPANRLLAAAINGNDRAIISKIALEEPISAINSAISVAKNTDARNAAANLAAGKKLMTSTKKALKEVRDIAGVGSPQYQMIADNLAKQILQCGINYYNNAPDDDVESPRKAMGLQEYALEIAVGKLTKDRCQENYDILKKAVDNMPPAEVAVETRKIKDELKKFCQLPDKISHSVTLLNNTKPLLQAIKAKLGATNSFYLSLSTQIVDNALYNVIEEVNKAQDAFGRMIEECKRRGINFPLLGSTPIDNVKSVIRDAWKATLLMDSFDMGYEFITKRYNPNRQSLKEMCKTFDVSTESCRLYPPTGPVPVMPTKKTMPNPAKPITPPISEKSYVGILLCVVIFCCGCYGALADGYGFDIVGFLVGAVLGGALFGFITKVKF